MDAFVGFMLLAIVSVVVYFSRYFWLLTHRISVKRNGQRVQSPWRTLEQAIASAVNELSSHQNTEHRTEIEYDVGFIAIRAMRGDSKNVAYELTFTGPDPMIDQIYRKLAAERERLSTKS